eukprot:scaffold316549_cov15-Tisochrysis_lutea.AAC.2
MTLLLLCTQASQCQLNAKRAIYGWSCRSADSAHVQTRRLCVCLQVAAYVEAAGRKSDFERTELAKDKTGVFTGVHALLNVQGCVQECSGLRPGMCACGMHHCGMHMLA